MKIDLEDPNRMLSLGFTFVILTSLLGIGYFAVTPQATSDPYTELYVFGSEGNASDYPTNLTVGEAGTVTVGVTNREHETETYTVVVRLAEEAVETETTTIPDEETWRHEFTFTPSSPGEKALRVLLFLGEDADLSSEPYREIWLQLEVTQ